MQLRYHISASFQYYDTHSKVYVLYIILQFLTIISDFPCILYLHICLGILPYC